jgi:hypothetical protein
MLFVSVTLPNQHWVEGVSGTPETGVGDARPAPAAGISVATVDRTPACTAGSSRSQSTLIYVVLGGAATFVSGPTLRQRCQPDTEGLHQALLWPMVRSLPRLLTPHPTSHPRTCSAYGFCLSEPTQDESESSAGKNSRFRTKTRCTRSPTTRGSPIQANTPWERLPSRQLYRIGPRNYTRSIAALLAWLG